MNLRDIESKEYKPSEIEKRALKANDEGLLKWIKKAVQSGYDTFVFLNNKSHTENPIPPNLVEGFALSAIGLKDEFYTSPSHNPYIHIGSAYQHIGPSYIVAIGVYKNIKEKRKETYTKKGTDCERG